MLSDIETLVLSKVDGKGAREGVEPGIYPIDFTVRVAGEVRVGEDTDKVPTVSIPLKEVLALFIARSGVTRESSINLLRECMQVALSSGPRGQGAIDAQVDIDEVFKAAVGELTASLPRTPVKGVVKTRVSITRV